MHINTAVNQRKQHTLWRHLELAIVVLGAIIVDDNLVVINIVVTPSVVVVIIEMFPLSNRR